MRAGSQRADKRQKPAGNDAGDVPDTHTPQAELG
jgi:hypothetical protein